MAKWFKFQLAYSFSHYSKQELPTSKFIPVCIPFLIPSIKQAFKNRVMNAGRPRRSIIILWNLMQSKTLAAEVPRSMIIDTYIQHSKVMTKVSDPLSSDLESEIREFVQPWVTNIRNHFTGLAPLPKNHACFENKRSLGGNKAEVAKLLLHPSSDIYEGRIRIDPVVIHIEGAPGVGKSHMVSLLCDKITEFYGCSPEDVYSRSAATKHWDGYKGQFITVIDDLAMNVSGYTDVEDTRTELYQLCSNVDYILPMAKLSEKGIKFNSHFLILTSNHATTSTRGVTSEEAYLRRISPTYRLRKLQNGNVGVYRTTLGDDVSDNRIRFRVNDPKFSPCGSITSGKLFENRQLYIEELCNTIISDCTTTYEIRKTHMNKDVYYQKIRDSNFVLKYLKPDSKLSEVMCHAIPEPLKVRMITKPEASMTVLKPVQEAMFEALKNWECFTPCWCPEYYEGEKPAINRLLNPGKLLLSGDYTNATDDLNMNASFVVMKEIAKQFSDIPFLEEQILREGGKHLIHYPPWTMISSRVQENGQLMGSLLSFPILCILNAFTMCKATGTDLNSVPALFHGDDIAASVTLDEFNKWKENAKNIGLSLSIGKNYLGPDWVSIDSQLFFRSNDKFIKPNTGKFRLINRGEDGELCATSALKAGFTKSDLKRFCGELLGNCPRSLDIHTDFGGLSSLEEDYEVKINHHDLSIYLTDLQSKTRIRQLGNNLFEVPELIAQAVHHRLGTQLTEWDSKVDQNQFMVRWKKMKKELPTCVSNIDSSRLVPLGSIKRVTIHCVSHSLFDLQNLIAKLYPVYGRQGSAQSSKARVVYTHSASLKKGLWTVMTTSDSNPFCMGSSQVLPSVC